MEFSDTLCNLKVVVPKAQPQKDTGSLVMTSLMSSCLTRFDYIRWSSCMEIDLLGGGVVRKRMQRLGQKSRHSNAMRMDRFDVMC
jgi:wobble nucleotide-excising tRNase